MKPFSAESDGIDGIWVHWREVCGILSRTNYSSPDLAEWFMPKKIINDKS